jgi:hypothetical protein
MYESRMIRKIVKRSIFNAMEKRLRNRIYVCYLIQSSVLSGSSGVDIYIVWLLLVALDDCNIYQQ